MKISKTRKELTYAHSHANAILDPLAHPSVREMPVIGRTRLQEPSPVRNDEDKRKEKTHLPAIGSMPTCRHLAPAT